MKPIKDYLNKIQKQFGTRSSKVGSYSFFLTVIVLAILITVNFALSFLPDSYVQEDLTANQLYSISSQSKVMLSSLEEDITIYWIVTSGQEDEFIEKLLHNYEDYSSKVTVEKKDPDLDPEFTNSYTDETVYNNSVIVECGDKYRYISYEDMYESSSSYYSMYSTADQFAGESLITSAISYCTTDVLPVIHVLEGHGEDAVTEGFQNALDRDNLQTESLTLLNGESVPEDVECILINSPATDISETEKDMLIDFLDNGGRVMIISGTNEEDALPNLNAVAEYYGINVTGRGMARCPFHHDRHPSMKLDQRFHCFGCQADGDVIDFVAGYFSLSVRKAALKLADDFGIRYEKQRPPDRGKRKKKVKAVSLEQNYKKLERRCFSILGRYRDQLLFWKKKLSLF